MAKGKRGQRGQASAGGGKRSVTGTITGVQAAPRTNATSARSAAGAPRPGGSSNRPSATSPKGASGVPGGKPIARASLSPGAARRRGQQLPWWRQRQAITIFGTLVGVLVIVGIFIAVAQSQAGSADNGKLASASLVSAVTGVSQQTSDKISSGGQSNPFHALPAGTVLTGPNGKPELLYI